MNHKTFFKRLTIGAAAIAVAPKILAETGPTGIILAPPSLSPEKMQQFVDEWKKYKGVIIYKSNTKHITLKNDKMEKEDFKTRLLDEKIQLTEKIGKLEAFLQSDKSNSIDQIQLALLGIQLPAMKTYCRCLDERIGIL